MNPSNDKAQTSLDRCCLLVGVVELVERMVVGSESVARTELQVVFGSC